MRTSEIDEFWKSIDKAASSAPDTPYSHAKVQEWQALRKECREAFKAIATALSEPAGGEYWSARKILTKYDIYHDDLQGERVLRVLAELMLKKLASRKRKGGGK